MREISLRKQVIGFMAAVFFIAQVSYWHYCLFSGKTSFMNSYPYFTNFISLVTVFGAIKYAPRLNCFKIGYALIFPAMLMIIFPWYMIMSSSLFALLSSISFTVGSLGFFLMIRSPYPYDM